MDRYRKRTCEETIRIPVKHVTRGTGGLIEFTWPPFTNVFAYTRFKREIIPGARGELIHMETQIGEKTLTQKTWIVRSELRGVPGGQRSWWACPGCWKAAGALFLPPNATAWQCRKCHHLAFESQFSPGLAYIRTLMRQNIATTAVGMSPQASVDAIVKAKLILAEHRDAIGAPGARPEVK